MHIYKFSIVIPVYNEEENIKNLVSEINQYLKEYKEYEIIIVNDGSIDNSLSEIKNIMQIWSNIKVINIKINKGQSHALKEGINKSKYNTIVTIDGDGQNNPSDILKLLKIYSDNEFICLVGGIRFNRKDSLIKRISSILANKIRQFILKDNCKDTGCSLKVFDKKIFLSLPFFTGIHRFLPALFLGYGSKTTFVNVDHRPRLHGSSKYGTIGRLIGGIKDIIKVAKIIKKFKKDRA